MLENMKNKVNDTHEYTLLLWPTIIFTYYDNFG